MAARHKVAWSWLANEVDKRLGPIVRGPGGCPRAWQSIALEELEDSLFGKY